MQIEPMPGVIYLKTQATKVGGLDTSGKESAVEYAEVLAVGSKGGEMAFQMQPSEFVLAPGDHVFVKAWAIDTIDHEGVRYEFVHVATNGILAKANP